MFDEIKDRMYDDGPIQPVGTPGFHSGYLQALHDRNWLIEQVDRLREALTWTEKFYSTALSENGCPCRHALKLFMTTTMQPQDSRVAEAVEQTRSAIAENGRLITELCALETTVCQERLSGQRIRCPMHAALEADDA